MIVRKGVTLLELLIALALAAIVTYFAYDLLVDENRNYVRVREKIKVQADARDAMRIMETEIRNAGFAGRASTSRISDGSSSCADVEFNNATGAVIQATNNSASITTGDRIVFRSFLLGAGGTLPTTCATGAGSLFQEIGYRLNGGSLERYLRQDNAAAQVWVPFLNDVVSFQVQYGVANNPSTTIGVEATILNQANWSTTGGTTVGCGTKCLTLRGWAAGSLRTWGTNLSGYDVKRGETYRVVFTLRGNAGFIDSMTTGTVTGYDRSTLRVGIVETIAGGFLDSITVWAGDPLVPSPTAREVYLTMPKNATNVKFAVRGSLMSTAIASTPAQELNISDLSIQQVNAGTFLSWVSNPTAAQMGAVRAVRLTLLAKTQDKNREGETAHFTGTDLGDPALPDYTASGADTARSHILLQRIIPVVNNGN